MPRAAILYHSLTGNTKLACEYIASRIPQVDFDLIDMREMKDFDPGNYSVIGFASYVDFQGPPHYFISSLNNIKVDEKKPAFVVCTYAAIMGSTLKTMKKMVEQRGFKVMMGAALCMPESFPPMRKKGMIGDVSPKQKDLEAFQGFIRKLGDAIITYDLKGEVLEKPIKIGLFNTLFKGKDREKSKKDMGKIILDRDSCTRCGICAGVCPHIAIMMNELPVFDESKCRGCYSCYNHCPVYAISCEKIMSGHSYKGVSEELKKKLSY